MVGTRVVVAPFDHIARDSGLNHALYEYKGTSEVKGGILVDDYYGCVDPVSGG